MELSGAVFYAAATMAAVFGFFAVLCLIEECLGWIAKILH